MKIEFMKKIKIVIIVITSIIVFIGAQIHPASISGEVQSIYEALAMALSIFLVQYMFISDYMFNSLQEHGLNIQYNHFQFVGLLVILFMLYVVSSAYIYYPSV